VRVPDPRLNIVFEDERLLVLNKPAGLVCHPTKGDEYSSLVGRVRIHLGPKYHLINRLDRETSGLVLIAKQDTAARALRRAWESRNVRKIYYAIVHGRVENESGKISEPLGRDLDSHVAIKDCVRADGLAAETSYRRLRHFERDGRAFSYLEVEPHSGRKHQIRIHLAHIGHPIVGDKIYGGDEDLYIDFIADRLTDAQRAKLILPHHALHAQRLEFQLQNVPMAFEAPAEIWFSEFLGQEAIAAKTSLA
jgi:23S rRNA pseudouridine1911/1915/1917 synthase